MDTYDALASDLREAFAHVLDRADALDEATSKRVAQALIDGGDDTASIGVNPHLRAVYSPGVRRDLIATMPTNMTIFDVAIILDCDISRARRVLVGLEPLSDVESAALDEAFGATR